MNDRAEAAKMAEEGKAAGTEPPVVSEEARAEHQKQMSERRANRRREQSRQERVKKGARCFRTRPNTLIAMKALPEASDYPQDSAGGKAQTLNMPYIDPVCSNPEDHTPLALAQLKIPAKEWPYHAP